MSVQDTATAVLEKFPHSEFTKIRGDGDYSQLYELRKQVYQNLVEIPCPYGAENDGHLGLGMSPAQYELRTGTRFRVPEDPGSYDESIAAASGSVLQARKEAEHKEAGRAFKTYRAVESVTKKLLKKALPESLLVEIEDEILGLNDVAIIDILEHCFDRRGQLTDTLVEDNHRRAEEPFDRSEGMANYIRRMEQCQQLATDAGEAWTDAQLVRRGQTAMGKSGLFRDEYKEWLRRDRQERSWVDFKKYWLQRYAEYEELNKLTTVESTLEAHAAFQDPQNQRENDLNAAMDNLVAIMSSDKGQVETLIATNADLTAQIKALTETNTRLTMENANLIGIITKIAGNAPAATTGTSNANRDLNYDPNGYCWTHGYRVHKNHNSANCKSKAPGHQDAATRANLMGGSTKNKDWVKK